MTTLEALVGLEPDSRDVRRAELLADNDRALLKGLVTLRVQRGLSQSEVGRRMGISQPSVAALERHDANPTLATLRRYANAVEALVRHDVIPDDGRSTVVGDPQWQSASLDLGPVRAVPARPLAAGQVTVRTSVGESDTSRTNLVRFPAA